ncbi:MAG: hypothetical protein SGI72_03490 [Planctomycetota bacterium]|nr:hypothetical protein [Planctomycetota bacterium]
MSTHPLIFVLALTPAVSLAQTGAFPIDEKTPPRALAGDVEGHAFDTEALAHVSRPDGLASSLAPATALRRDSDRLYFDVAVDGTIWARGKTYKASFGSAATTYVPFLGSKAPRNFPLGMRVQSVTIGGEPVAFEVDAPAVRTGDTISFERGAFVERYALTPSGIEQSFVFETPLTQGGIVILIGLESELEGHVDVDGFRFANEFGWVHYGHAFVLHDALDATRIESRLVSGGIELVVPAEIVEGAVGSLVIDPLLATGALADTTIDEFAADIAFDATNANWITAFEEVFSATDHDVHVLRHISNGVFSASDYIDSSTSDWRAPAIANNNLDDQYLVVAAVGAAPAREIWGRTVEATISINLSAKFQISENAQSGDKYAPDVGGDPSVNPSADYCVVWEREFLAGVDYDIHTRLVRTDATFPVATILLESSALTIDRNPAISNSNGNAANADQDWNIVWEHEVSATNRNIFGARVHYDGVITAATFTIASSTLDERNPSCTSIVDDTGGTRPWMVAFQIDNGANNWDVRCRTLNGTSIISTLDLSAQFPNQTFDQITPGCDTDRGQFVVVWDERTTPLFFATDIKVASLYSLGGALGVNEGPISVAPGSFTDQRPKVTTATSAGPSVFGFQVQTVGIVYDRDVGAHRDVWVAGYDVPNGGPVTSACSGDGTATACPCANTGSAGHGCATSTNVNGVLLYPSGNALLSQDTFAIVASGMPEGAPSLFFQGTVLSNGGIGTVFGDGLLCVGGTIVRLGVKFTNGGFTSYPGPLDPEISVQGGVPAAGAVRYYQCWLRDAPVFCTVSTFNLTNALRVQWIP